MTFDEVLDLYEQIWLKPLDTLAKQSPFAAACLVCISLDHLGNAARQDQVAVDAHGDAYAYYIKKYLGSAYQEPADVFPDDADMRARFYEALRCGLVHEARTDDHRKVKGEAAPVWLSHVDFSPRRVSAYDDMYVSVPWLVRAVKSAWRNLRDKATEDALRKRLTERLIMVVQEKRPEQPLQSPRNGGSTSETMPASGSGLNFVDPLSVNADERLFADRLCELDEQVGS